MFAYNKQEEEKENCNRLGGEQKDGCIRPVVVTVVKQFFIITFTNFMID